MGDVCKVVPEYVKNSEELVAVSSENVRRLALKDQKMLQRQRLSGDVLELPSTKNIRIHFFGNSNTFGFNSAAKKKVKMETGKDCWNYLSEYPLAESFPNIISDINKGNSRFSLRVHAHSGSPLTDFTGKTNYVLDDKKDAEIWEKLENKGRRGHDIGVVALGTNDPAWSYKKRFNDFVGNKNNQGAYIQLVGEEGFVDRISGISGEELKKIFSEEELRNIFHEESIGITKKNIKKFLQISENKEKVKLYFAFQDLKGMGQEQLELLFGDKDIQAIFEVNTIEEAQRMYEELLVLLKKIQHTNGIEKLVVMTYPKGMNWAQKGGVGDRQHMEILEKFNELIREKSEEYRYRVVDIADEFQRRDPKQEILYQYTGKSHPGDTLYDKLHFNAKGHELIAYRLQMEMKQMFEK